MTGPFPAAPPGAFPEHLVEADLFFPASASDINNAMIPVASAAVPDGFLAHLLKSVPPFLLRVLVNLLLLARRAPVALWEARTTFISKTTDATEPSQFRPITVASVLTVLQFQGKTLGSHSSAGVCQGDPLSPVLFNLALAEYLTNVDHNIAFVGGDLRFDAIAFADDLVVFA
ncbi:hypothetical protein IscW_ISCW003937 [Ixodes scapularis]|uniref:Reverse transcriptase domain-containing protein n=1 Tax=Ixodes scapularis TaxID=6945 RepID=B7PIQ5_IXOSC|nr:hypothetical protein IscW_ISCW003937 [Ixodes scapularis]|eukprot:XP_002405804.1 hypothetical protein IscW_ISCW003937 [Ixodes scapularis]